MAEANWVLTVEFGEMWDGEFWRVEESWDGMEGIYGMCVWIGESRIQVWKKYKRRIMKNALYA